MCPTLQHITYTTTSTTTTTVRTNTTAFKTNTTSSLLETMSAEIIPSLVQELSLEFCRSHPLSLDRQMEIIARYHNHRVGPNQCTSVIVRRMAAPAQAIWGLVKQFDRPQTYKPFLRSCRMITGSGGQVGSLREVHCISGLPAVSSTERLEVLDEESRAIGFSILGGEHRLQNYRSITTVHPTYSTTRVNNACSGDEDGTVVVESYVVDVPQGNTKQDTCVFVDTIIRCNLHSLANLAERMATSSSLSAAMSSSCATSSSSCKVS